MLCPFDCGVCREAECRAGCRLTGEPMLEVCYRCGEVVTPLSRTVVCVCCADDTPPVERRKSSSMERRKSATMERRKSASMGRRKSALAH